MKIFLKKLSYALKNREESTKNTNFQIVCVCVGYEQGKETPPPNTT